MDLETTQISRFVQFPCIYVCVCIYPSVFPYVSVWLSCGFRILYSKKVEKRQPYLYFLFFQVIFIMFSRDTCVSSCFCALLSLFLWEQGYAFWQIWQIPGVLDPMPNQNTSSCSVFFYQRTAQTKQQQHDSSDKAKQSTPWGTPHTARDERRRPASWETQPRTISGVGLRCDATSSRKTSRPSRGSSVKQHRLYMRLLTPFLWPLLVRHCSSCCCGRRSPPVVTYSRGWSDARLCAALCCRGWKQHYFCSPQTSTATNVPRRQVCCNLHTCPEIYCIYV